MVVLFPPLQRRTDSDATETVPGWGIVHFVVFLMLGNFAFFLFFLCLLLNNKGRTTDHGGVFST